MKQSILIILCHLLSICMMASTNISLTHREENKNNKEETDSHIIGHVINKETKEHLPYATIYLQGTTIYAITDATGHYFIKNAPIGNFTIEATFTGYISQSFNINIQKGKTQEIDFELTEDVSKLEEVIISSNRSETTRKSTASLVNIIDTKIFDKTNACTIAEGLNFQPGLRVEYNCQNCGLPQIRMNGLEGAYSQILIDSRPIFSSLSGVYGLEQIPTSMIDRVEIVRGGGSALCGSAAIAGTINIITKEPLRNSAHISHNITSIGGKAKFDNITNLNASIISDDNKTGLMIFGQKRGRAGYDHNNDGFTEASYLNGRTIGFRSYFKIGTYSKITLEYHNMHEFRRGGDLLKEEPFNAYIAEQAESNIDGGSINYNFLSSDYKHKLNIYAASQLNRRKSYYGAGEPIFKIEQDHTLTDNEKTEQINNRLFSFGNTKGLTITTGAQYSYNFDKLWFMPAFITAGLEYTYDKINDRSGYRKFQINQNVDTKSIYAQNEWKNEKLSFLIGIRADYNNLLENIIINPRANIRYNPIKNVNLRISYAQGYRAPQIFDEDLHVDLAGGNMILRELDPNLKEEKSHSISGSVDWYSKIGKADFNFLVEGFFTKLNNPFTPVFYQKPDGTIIKLITNTSGAKVYGANIEANVTYKSIIQLQLGATIQRSLYDKAQKWSGEEIDNIKPMKEIMRTPNIYGYFISTITPLKQFSATVSGKYTGRMYVPYEGGEMLNRTVHTNAFFELGCKFAYEIPFYKGSIIELNAGLQNILNSYQKDFDKGPDRISSYIYGPAMPRCYFMGIRISL